MSNTTASLTRRISSPGDLQSVVRTLKALAASSIGQYEKSVSALGDYYHTVELGLELCFRQDPNANVALVTTPPTPSPSTYARLADAKLPLANPFEVPHSVQTIAPSRDTSSWEAKPHATAGTATPLSARSRTRPIPQRPQARKTLPERIEYKDTILRSLLREYLFSPLFRACAKSLASKNASRLAAMERADKNIEELLDTLHRHLNHIRQSSIDEELFDVISGFQALSKG